MILRVWYVLMAIAFLNDVTLLLTTSMTFSNASIVNFTLALLVEF